MPETCISTTKNELLKVTHSTFKSVGKSCAGIYRYGFNGKERDKEWGGGATYDYGFRIYNAQIGKFLSVDPLAKSFPWNSSYSYAENQVIWAIDLDGLERFVIVYSPYVRDQMKQSLKIKNYKQVMSWYSYASSHAWVDENGNRSDYYQELYSNRFIPTSKSAFWDLSHKYHSSEYNRLSRAYGEEKDGGGWTQFVFFNAGTGFFEDIGIVPTAKKDEDGKWKRFVSWKNGEFWKIVPSPSEELKDYVIETVATTVAVEALEKFILKGGAGQVDLFFDIHEWSDQKTYVEAMSRLKTVGPNSVVYFETRDPVEGKLTGFTSVSYTIDTKTGKDTFTIKHVSTEVTAEDAVKVPKDGG